MKETDKAARRLFIGLLPDEETREAIVAHRHYWRWAGDCKLTDAPRLHITMHFLGNLEPARERPLLAALENVTVKPAQFRLNAQQVWNNGVAALLPEDNGEMNDLYQRLGLATLIHAGLLAPRKWTPHVTLARSASQALPPEAAPSIRWPVRDIALVWSHSGRYEVLGRFPRSCR
jgi:RNA 2',3'-cyclic 3'-phosphodiesterase